ncbi:ribosome maturation factor RimM [candidate division KSB1 bacterium]
MRTIFIGIIIKPHGLKGDVIVRTHSGNAKNLKAGSTYKFVLAKEKISKIEVLEVKKFKKNYRVKFKGITDREKAEGIIGAEIGIPEDELENLAENEIYVIDLIGCEVFTTEGKYTGVVDDVVNNPGVDLLKLKCGQESHLIPFVREFIKDVDIENRKIVIEPIEGLI